MLAQIEQNATNIKQTEAKLEEKLKQEQEMLDEIKKLKLAADNSQAEFKKKQKEHDEIKK